MGASSFSQIAIKSLPVRHPDGEQAGFCHDH